MPKFVILLDAGELVALPGTNDGDVLTWNGTLGQWQSSPGGGVGTVTSVALDTASTGLTVSGGTTQTITGAGTFTLGGTLGAANGGTGLGAPVAGNAGKVLAATALGTYELVTNGNGTVTSVTAGAGLDGGIITASGTISMPNVGTAASYGSASSVPVITTDAQGRVSTVTPTAIAIAQSQVADLVTDLAGKVSTSTQVIAGTGLSGGGALSGNVTLSLPSVGTAGTYGSASSVAVVTTDAQGRVSNAVTTAIAIAQSQVADLVTDLGLKADKSVTATAGTGLTGGGTLGANFSFALNTVGTAQTSLGSASKTVTISTDAYGRVTALSEQAIGSLPASAISSGQLALAQGGTGIDASSVTGGQLLVGGTGVLALQNVSGDASLASTGALTVTRLQGNPVSATVLGAPDAGKALVWSGTAWQATTIQGGGGGGGLVLYMNYAASSPYPLDTVFDENAGWDTGAITVANDANGTELARFLTSTAFVIEVIPAGIWDINVYAQASGAINDTAIRAKVAVWNGSTLTVLGTSDYTYLNDPSVLTQYKASVFVPTTDLTSGERIAIVLEGRRFAATTQTVTNYFGTGAISHVHSTLNAPGGTGLLKVVDGYLQSPASLLVDADVSATAAIAVSKLAAGTNTYVLTTVAGVPTWSAPASTGVTSLTGTADQVLVGGTTGSPQTGALTLTLPQDIGTGSSPTFATVFLSSVATGLLRQQSDPFGPDFIQGGATVDLNSEVTGILAVGSGGTGLTSSGTSGNILVSNGSALASVAMSSDATIASTGALTLKNTGTAGTYGSASAVPVFVTDAQGRVSSVTNTNIEIGASAITSGVLGVTYGGTGLSSIVSGRLLYASSTNTLAAGTLSSLDWSATFPATNIEISPSFVPSGAGRTTSITGGFSGTGTAGALALNGGNSTSGTGGSTTVRGGAGGTGTGGALDLRGGSGSTANGALTLGTTTTSSVTIGATGITTTLNGTVSLENALSLANGGTNNGSLSVTQGTVYYGDGAKLVGLAPGTSGQFLQTQGAGANPQWASAGSATTPYDILGRFAGNPATNAVLYSSPVPRAVTVSTTTGNHYFYASALPSAGTSVITVYKTLASNGTKSALFTATWTAGQAAASNGLYQAVIGVVSNNTLVAGDVLSVEMGTTNTSFVNPQFAVSATA